MSFDSKLQDMRLEIWGTAFFVVLAGHFVGLQAIDLIDLNQFQALIFSVLSTKFVFFWLLAWVISLYFRKGPSQIKKMFFDTLALFRSKSYRLLAFKNFKQGFYNSWLFVFTFLFSLRYLGAAELDYNQVGIYSLWRNYYMITDPLAAFTIYYALVDWLRRQLLLYSQDHFALSGFLVAVLLETMAWMEFFKLRYEPINLLLLLSVVLFFSLCTAKSILRKRSFSFWKRLATALTLFTAVSIMTNLLTSTWSYSYSFYSIDHSNLIQIQMMSLLLACAINAALLQKFYRPLTRTE